MRETDEKVEKVKEEKKKSFVILRRKNIAFSKRSSSEFSQFKQNSKNIYL